MQAIENILDFCKLEWQLLKKAPKRLLQVLTLLLIYKVLILVYHII